MGVQTPNTTALEKLFEPHKADMDVLKEALKEVTQEENEKKKGSAKELVRKCMELKGRMDQAEREFTSNNQKWDKELGKTIKRLQNMASGRPVNDGVEEDKDKEESPASESDS